MPSAFGITPASSFAGGPGTFLGLWDNVEAFTTAFGGNLTLTSGAGSVVFFSTPGGGPYADGIEVWNSVLANHVEFITARPAETTPDSGSTICLLAAAMGVLPLLRGGKRATH